MSAVELMRACINLRHKVDENKIRGNISNSIISPLYVRKKIRLVRESICANKKMYIKIHHHLEKVHHLKHR